jgi:hypothetical protein
VICFHSIGHFRGKTRLSTGFQDIDWVFPDLKDLWFFVTDIELCTELVFQDTVFLNYYLLFMMRQDKALWL